jgi:predicted Fe-Mo cluster-binding NifX family protein
MKIAITSEEKSLESLVDPRFGRAKHFAIADTDTGDCSFHDNEKNLNAPQGAGIQAAQAVAQLGAKAVLTGHVGPKAFATLDAAKVAVYTGIAGTVEAALEQYKGGQLTPTTQADVEGHW